MTTSQAPSTQDETAKVLREAMVRDVCETEELSEQVVDALRVVPRHLFTPGQPLEAAYAAHETVMLKQSADGKNLSVVSAPWLQARMIEQAGLEPGMNVLEIGSGGYNAALVARIVGESGQVTTLDIDPEIVDRARGCLDSAGYGWVRTVLADGEHGAPDAAPLDRIIVTAGAWDIAPAWLAQLAPNGRIVVPLRMRGLTRSVAFDRDPEGRGLISRTYRLCQFVAMQGDGAYDEQVYEFADGAAGLAVDDGQKFDLEALAESLRAGVKIERWSGAAFDLPDELALFLMTSAPMTMLHAKQTLIDEGLLNAAARRGCPTLVDGDSFAYRIKRANPEGGFESGVLGYGPHAEQVVERYVALLRTWAANYRRRDAATVRYLPKALGTTPEPSPGVIVKRHGAVTITWP